MSGRLLAIVLLVLVNGLLVGAEFALVRARRPRLEALARNGDRLARIALHAMSSTGRMFSATQLGITMASLGLGWLMADVFRATPPWLPGWPGTALRGIVVVGAVALLHIVLGELVPKAAALSEPERLARLLAPPLVAFARLTAPFTMVLDAVARLALGTLRRGPVREEERVHSSDELRLLVEQSQERGALEPQDADLLEGVFEFSEKNARGVMTPRTEIVALAADASLDETLTAIAENGLSRYPVYEESVDNIVGIVLAKDVLPVLRKPPPTFSVRDIMRPVHVVPGTRQVEEVLADFKRLKEHMAVVLDEYGGTAGVVTMEDLLEEIVGEILDEHDEAEPPQVARTGEIVVPGETTIGDLNERYGLTVPDREYTTIGGFVFGMLGRVPQPGDRVPAGGAAFIVRAMDGRRVDRLAVKLTVGAPDTRPPGPRDSRADAESADSDG